MASSEKKGILQRLEEGPVVGDGSMCMTLEKRGYCKAGPWTPEAVIEYPDAVLQLQREYLRAGSDVIQTASFYSSDDKLGYGVDQKEVIHTSASLNDAACKIARKVADEGNALVCGAVSPVPSYRLGKGEAAVRAEFEKQIAVFREHDVDFVLAEFFCYIEELEIAVDVLKKLKKPIAVNMRTGLHSDYAGIPFEDIVIRMAKTGANIIGLNCKYDVNTHLKAMKRMKEILDAENFHPYLMTQPLGWMCPEVENHKEGYAILPEVPFALEPRNMTRMEVRKFARAAWDLGVRYIGGCCGFEPHHIRAIAQELTPERKRHPIGHDMFENFGERFFSCSTLVKDETVLGYKRSREHWMNVKPGFGRPDHEQ